MNRVTRCNVPVVVVVFFSSSCQHLNGLTGRRLMCWLCGTCVHIQTQPAETNARNLFICKQKILLFFSFPLPSPPSLSAALACTRVLTSWQCRLSVCAQVPSAAAGHRQPGGRTVEPGQAARVWGWARAVAQGGDGEGTGAVPAGVWETAEEAGGTTQQVDAKRSTVLEWRDRLERERVSSSVRTTLASCENHHGLENETEEWASLIKTNCNEQNCRVSASKRGWISLTEKKKCCSFCLKRQKEVQKNWRPG